MSRLYSRCSILLVVLVLGATLVSAQMPPQGHQKGHRGPPSPEDREKMERLGALRTTAEAYKNLADLYAEQDKTDDAVAQLKKILDLTANVDEREVPKFKDQLSHVYMQIAEIYLRKDRVSDAEAILNEGVQRFKDSPEITSRMYLQLGNILRKSGKTQEAEKMFQRVIEINSSAISSPGTKK